MVTLAKESDKVELMELWKLGFGDPDEFIDFYFNNRYISENTVIYKKMDIITSAAQIFPYDIRYFSSILKSVYILGVVTHPNHLRHGYSKTILISVLENLYNERVSVATLIPQGNHLFEMYKLYGFSKTFYLNECVCKRNKTHENGSNQPFIINKHSNVTQDIFGKFYNFYINMYNKNDCAIIKSQKDFKFTIDEFILFEGEIILSINNLNEIDGCGFLTLFEATPYIKEFLYENECAKNLILNKSFERTNTPELSCCIPPYMVENNNVRALGMSRVINVLDVLNSFAKYHDASFSIKISDPIISANNGIYLVDGAKASRAAQIMVASKPDFEMTIDEFATAIFGCEDLIDGSRDVFQKISSYANLLLN